jgi:tRNA G18 (ribose-2'-O)-methylase SpoU
VSHGVGPWDGDWPDDARLDPELLRDGDRRNVEDRYRYWSHEAITADLATRRHDFHVAIENWEHDFNIGSVVRTANAMGAAAFHIVGKRRWNRRGAMVTDRYQVEHHHPDVADLVEWASTAGEGGTPLRLIGISPEMLAACDDVLEISQFGSTRSMNAGAAAAIAMHAWVRRHHFGQTP